MTELMTELKDEAGRPVGTVLTAIATSALAAVSVLLLVGVLVLVFGQRSGGLPTDVVADPGLTPRAAGQEATPATDAASAGSVAVPADSKVVVLNATSRKGLAGRFQQALAAKGWNVVAIGNFRGNVPATTVYYPEGQRAAAEALEAQFAEVNRIRPAFSGISQTRLTVILTGDGGP
jgi:LytR cell envelope-related transcriptional attenuator